MGEVRELSPEASDTFKTDVSAAIKVLLPQQDLSQVSLSEFRASLAEHLGLQHAVPSAVGPAQPFSATFRKAQ